MISHGFLVNDLLKKMLLPEIPVLSILARVANREAMNGGPLYHACATDVVQLAPRAVTSARDPQRSREYPPGQQSPKN